MADWFQGRSFVELCAEAIVRGGSAPSSTGYHLILLNTGAGAGNIAATMTASTVVASELSATNGYARQNYAPSAGSFDTSQLRYEFPSVALTFTATGGNLVFNAIALLANSTSTVGNTSGVLAKYYNYPTGQTITNGLSRVITISGWNFLRGLSTDVGAES